MASSSPPSKRRRKNSVETTANTLSSPCPVVAFAHGAGAPSSSDWMMRWKNMLKDALHAIEVVTFDYPYFSGGKKWAPPKAVKSVDFHKDIVKNTAAKYPDHPLILAGKSMGSRVSCMVAAEDDITLSAIICLGYPLKGSKDALCPLEKLQAVCKKMKSHSEIHVIEGGDHSFKIAKKHLQTKGLTQDEAQNIAVQAIASFTSRSGILEKNDPFSASQSFSVSGLPMNYKF